LFFKSDPAIIWKKVMCPLCHEPTGPKSECYKLPPARAIPQYKRHVVQNGVVLPVFSKNCAWRNNNLWDAQLNYPVSEPLIKHLSDIVGINRILAIGPYEFRVSIALLFDEDIVKKDINIKYKTFIKMLQSKEIVNQQENPQCNNDIIGVILPNGVEVLTADQNISKSLLSELEGCRPLISENGANQDSEDQHKGKEKYS